MPDAFSTSAYAPLTLVTHDIPTYGAVFRDPMVDFDRLLSAYRAACQELLNQRTPAGHWEGRLSSSALSTATAVSSLALVRRHLACDDSPPAVARQEELGELIFNGLRWLAAAQNPDGGWGDTDRSLSNIATTMLVRAAFQLTCVPAEQDGLIERADRYIADQGGVAALRRRYGRDKTFAVPILTNCALAGLVPWKAVSPLPFELACFPQSWFRFLRLPVVSYAIPALVAIGQARYFHRRPWNPLVRWWRGVAIEKSLRVLEQMQPESGGFLEATPLTSFVVMSLAGIGQARHPVARRGLDFLLASVREDGSWPIDTNLATWVTTLSVNALANEACRERPLWRSADYPLTLPGDSRNATEGVPYRGSDLHPSETPLASGVVASDCLDWLLACQVREEHPYTGAAPGGWGWSDLSGSVPDADDTSGALLALAGLESHRDRSRVAVLDAAAMGARWLLGLQNSDGGWPTFCRGWGKLPFDRSGTDLTAHAIRALHAWRQACDVRELCGSANGSPTRKRGRTTLFPRLRFGLPRSARLRFGLASTKSVLTRGTTGGEPTSALRIDQAIESGFAYLARQQAPEGSWSPLWFGNQYHPHEENPVYGTARVLLAYADLHKIDDPSARRGLAWLASQQRRDGAWGESPSVEEAALAVESLLAAGGAAVYDQQIERGLDWLIEAVETGHFRHSSPIGLYFAKLWYYETLYPVIFTVAALGRAVRQFKPLATECRPDRAPRLPEPTLVEPTPAQLTHTCNTVAVGRALPTMN